MIEIQLSQMIVVKLTIEFRLQAHLSSTIVNYEDRAFLVLPMIGTRKEGSLHHKYRTKRISTYKFHSNLDFTKKAFLKELLFFSLHGELFLGCT